MKRTKTKGGRTTRNAQREAPERHNPDGQCNISNINHSRGIATRSVLDPRLQTFGRTRADLMHGPSFSLTSVDLGTPEVRSIWMRGWFFFFSLSFIFSFFLLLHSRFNNSVFSICFNIHNFLNRLCEICEICHTFVF